jgi:hypothetical protein
MRLGRAAAAEMTRGSGHREQIENGWTIEIHVRSKFNVQRPLPTLNLKY